MSVEQTPMAWLPHSIVDASVTKPPGGDVGLSEAWAHLLGKLERAAQTVQSDPASRNAVDLASGMRHLLVLLATGADEALRFDPDPILSVQRAEHQRHHHLGHGVPGLHLHAGSVARRRKLPTIR